MRGLLRFLLLSLCAEWLLALRIWLAPQALLCFLAMAVARFFLYGFIPYWQNTYLAFVLALAVRLWRLRAFLQGVRAPRAFYETPEDGVPWLVILARSPRLTRWLENVLALAFALWLMRDSPLVYPPGVRDLPPAWRDWLVHNGTDVATLHAFLTWLALVFWNVSQGAAAKPPERHVAAGSSRVREQAHSLPPLPTVKELAAEFERDDAP